MGTETCVCPAGGSYRKLIVGPHKESMVLLHGPWMNRHAVLYLPQAPSSSVNSVAQMSFFTCKMSL